jgi:hypoxanthine phosphoribosyltransferase
MQKEFTKVVSSQRIQKAISAMAKQLNSDCTNQNPLFISVLNGSFLFTADLVRQLKGNCEVSFVKVSSYKGTQQKKTVQELIGLNEKIAGRNSIILEDIVDSGNTLEVVYNELKKKKPRSIKVCSLFFKPQAYSKKIKIDYVGITMPNDFLIGYGLDLNGLYRNLKDVYKITQ